MRMTILCLNRLTLEAIVLAAGRERMPIIVAPTPTPPNSPE